MLVSSLCESGARVLVTGGSGNVGRVVIERLKARYEVAVFDRVAPPEGFEWIEGDILSLADCERAVRGCEGVVHLAAIPNPHNDPADRVFEVNVMGTQRVVAAAAAAGARRLVFASSDSTCGFVFGEGEIKPLYAPVDEEHPLRPRDAYGLSKLVGEQICRAHTRNSGLETVCLRYCWVWWEQHYRDIERLSSDPARFTGQLWAYVDCRDVAQAVEKSLATPDLTHETMFISAARTFFEQPTVELLQQYYPETEVRDPAYFEADPHRTPFNCGRARERIGYEPKFDWRDIAKK